MQHIGHPATKSITEVYVSELIDPHAPCLDKAMFTGPKTLGPVNGIETDAKRKMCTSDLVTLSRRHALGERAKTHM